MNSQSLEVDGANPSSQKKEKKSHTYIEDSIRLIDQLELHDHGEIGATDLES